MQPRERHLAMLNDAQRSARHLSVLTDVQPSDWHLSVLTDAQASEEEHERTPVNADKK